MKAEAVLGGEPTEDVAWWFEEKASRRRGGETFYSLLRQSSPAYEKCMEHQSGTQLFAWLRGPKRRMQPSLTHKHSRRSRGTMEAETQQEDERSEEEGR